MRALRKKERWERETDLRGRSVSEKEKGARGWRARLRGSAGPRRGPLLAKREGEKEQAGGEGSWAGERDWAQGVGWGFLFFFFQSIFTSEFESF